MPLSGGVRSRWRRLSENSTIAPSLARSNISDLISRSIDGAISLSYASSTALSTYFLAGLLYSVMNLSNI